MAETSGKPDDPADESRREDSPAPASDRPDPETRPEAAQDIASLYQEHAARLTAGLRKVFGEGPPAPEDVCQQAFCNLIERRGRADIRNPRAFLWRTACNIVFGARRAREVRARYDFEIEQLYFPPSDEKADPERILAVRAQLEAVKGILRDMPDKRRRALILHHIEGLSMTDVGRRLGISRQNAARHVSRAITDLNILLTDDGED